MDYRITDKEAFTVLASSKVFDYENAKQEIPAFWQEHYTSGRGKYVCGIFGINIDPQMGNERFEYLIADIYNPSVEFPEGLVVRTIPAFTWAVFPVKVRFRRLCREPMKRSFPNGFRRCMIMSLRQGTVLRCTMHPTSTPME